MTKLYFRYSYIYEESLAKLANEKFEWEDFQQTQKFVEKFGEYWEQHNDSIFNYYKSLGLTLPDFWLAYPINKKTGLTPFSDPLTFFIDNDFEKTCAVLIHELCHVFLTVSENINLSSALWEEVVRKYPLENFNTHSHLLVNLLARGGVVHIFGKDKAGELLLPERALSGLKKAWKIIDLKPEVLLEADPILAIRKL